MQITEVRVRNFRSIKDIKVELDPATVFIGPNNAGKSAIIDAIRIALTRRWGRRGTGFNEHDIHASGPGLDPRDLEPIIIDLKFEERDEETWPEDLISALDAIAIVSESGRNQILLRVTCGWNADDEAFLPSWEFLNSHGEPLTGRAAQSTNLNNFFNYPQFFWLSALRDASDEFGPRSTLWGGLLRSVKVPKELEETVKKELDEIDRRLVESEPLFAEIANSLKESLTVSQIKEPGTAKIRLLPLDIWDMLKRTAVILQMENVRPWLPLLQHGQGLQNLAVLYLFRIAMKQKLLEDALVGAEPILGIEEPEAHLHPQAARTLWARLSDLPGQKLVTSHSPQFIQNVPVHAIRMVSLAEQSEVSAMPSRIISELPWTDRVELAFSAPNSPIVKSKSETIQAEAWISNGVFQRILTCWRDEENQEELEAATRSLREEAFVLLSEDDQHQLSVAGRRIRGEIFFARKWLLVEGPSDFLMAHAIARAWGKPLDQAGVSVIDYQNNGAPGVYIALSTGLGIPWRMVCDGDDGGDDHIENVLSRGVRNDLLSARLHRHGDGHDLESQLISDGHADLLRELLHELGENDSMAIDEEMLLKRLKKRKVRYMARLEKRISDDAALAESMPEAFVKALKSLLDLE